MSLWLESLYGYVNANASLERQMEQARRILAHLAMPIPRLWWEQARERGHLLPQEDYLQILCGLRQQLLKVPSLTELAGIAELVAVAFLDDPSGNAPEYGHVGSQHSAVEYLESARKLLASDPGLARWATSVAEGTRASFPSL